MADFDWNWPKEIDRPAVERVLGLEFVSGAENVILVSAQGLGKTMIAKNIAHNAILAGHTALCVTASDLLFDLGRRDSATALEGRIRYYASVSVLLIDELGYLSYDSRAADLLFQTLSRRYEKKPTVLTTNLAFSDWPAIFPNAMCATTLVDRLTHHSEIITVVGESYRKREAEIAKQARKTRAKR